MPENIDDRSLSRAKREAIDILDPLVPASGAARVQLRNSGLILNHGLSDIWRSPLMRQRARQMRI